jgi:hypothetical protein
MDAYRFTLSRADYDRAIHTHTLPLAAYHRSRRDWSLAGVTITALWSDAATFDTFRASLAKA